MKNSILLYSFLFTLSLQAESASENPECEWNPTYTYTFKNTTGQIQPIETNIAFYWPANKSRDAMTLTLPDGTVRPPNNLYWPNWTTTEGTYDPTTQKKDPTKKLMIFKGQTLVFKTDRCIRHIELISLPNYETGQGFSQWVPVTENGKTTTKRSGVFDPGIPNIECNNIVLQQGEAARACTRISDNKTGGFGLAPNEHAVCMNKNYEIFVNTYNGIKALCLKEV